MVVVGVVGVKVVVMEEVLEEVEVEYTDYSTDRCEKAVRIGPPRSAI